MQKNVFEEIKRINKYGKEVWSARDLMVPLGYVEWRKFEGAVDRAKEACKNSGQKIEDHFAHAAKMVLIGSEAKRKVDDYHLSRYACYLIAQNGDPRKEEIALAQTYFALQTRKQEIREQMIEDGKRVFLRGEMKDSNKKLIKAAKESGVKNYAEFQDYGYMGLYGGLRQKDIHERKRLKKHEAILDHMGGEELAANLFRSTQTEAKLKREEIYGEQKASDAHYDVGKKVRKTIKELGGTMPEKLPTAEDIRKAKKRLGIKGKMSEDELMEISSVVEEDYKIGKAKKLRSLEDLM